MKFRAAGKHLHRVVSLPVRGAWIEMMRRFRNARSLRSLPVRGAWIEMRPLIDGGRGILSLPVRGAWIEIPSISTLCHSPPSLPVRGAWIEIETAGERKQKRCGRSPCGERGLKYQVVNFSVVAYGRSPCGERGLKYRYANGQGSPTVSLPVRGAWIEILCRKAACPLTLIAPRAGSVD